MANEGFLALNNATRVKTPQVGGILDGLKLSDLAQNTGRVLSVVLDEAHPRYSELGGPKAIGAIEYVDVRGTSIDYSTAVKNQKYTVAYPIDPSSKKYPLINEIVFLTAQPSKNIQSKTTAFNTYYVSIVNLWNHPHHNAIPYSAGSNTAENSKNYQDTAVGSVNKLTDSTGTIKFGKYFKERQDINPLKPFEGDFILEGRFSNTIRLGSTGGTSPWSSTGEQGSPIMILRNGQGSSYSNAWELITEDINTDASSIYLTSNQKIEIIPSSVNDYYSYTDKPEAADSYTENQIILNSGRLILNSKSDHILLSSAKTINLNAEEGIHFDTTKDVVIQSGKTLIGSKSADEPLLLGDTTVLQLGEMLFILKELLLAASTASNAGGPLLTLNSKALELLTRANLINLELTKSKRNFTV
jgi:hypothetical protein